MCDFKIIPAHVWANTESECVTFFGASGSYRIIENIQHFFYDGAHVGTNTGRITIYKPGAVLPKGYKKAVKEVLNIKH